LVTDICLLVFLPDDCKESCPKGPGFGLPLKGAVLLKAVQVKSV